MKIYSLIIILCVASILSAQTIESNFNGLSVITGNLRPEGPDFGITLQNEMIHMRELDTGAVYDILYEFKNTTTSYGVVMMTQPIQLYFNEFRPGVRSDALNQLAKLMPDIFKVEDPGVDIRDQLKNNFGQRLFIRRYVSSQNLKQLGIVSDIFRNNSKTNYTKVLMEFRWLDEDPYNLNKNTEVLFVDIKMIAEITFQPNEQFNILTFMKVPSTVAGIDELQIYSPFTIGYEKNWPGTIQNLYLQHDIFNATPILPSKYNYTTQYTGERSQVLVIKNITPVNNDKIAFYTIRENVKECGSKALTVEKSIIPSPIRNVTASSWDKSELKLTDRNYVATNEAATSNTIQTYQTGNPVNLDIFSNNWTAKKYNSYLLNDYLLSTCKGNVAEITLKESGHPIYAFDISNFNMDDSAFVGKENLQMQTAWCEGASGRGKGEYIEFELLQPISAIRIYNGNQLNDDVFTNSSKVDVIRFSSVDGLVEDRKYSIIDLPIQNLYPISLPAGKHRIYIDDIDDGKNQVTCLSSISFDFVLEDTWYQKSISTLENAYNKPK
ncbi:MAG: hypothetical protein IPN31_13505 [Bacteroidetes bacterium]|nr:hypothetical protein [Bacteroidota bacterium]